MGGGTGDMDLTLGVRLKNEEPTGRSLTKGVAPRVPRVGRVAPLAVAKADPDTWARLIRILTGSAQRPSPCGL